MANQRQIASTDRAVSASTPGRAAAVALAILLAGCDGPAMMKIRNALGHATENITGAFSKPAPPPDRDDDAPDRTATDRTATDRTATDRAGPVASDHLASLSPSEIDAGVRELMVAAIDRALPVLSHADGFTRSADYRIGLPPGLLEVREALASIGLSPVADDLEGRLNQAAGLAAVDLTPLVKARIAVVPIVDTAAIVTGQPDAATRHLEFNSAIDLLEGGRPAVAAALDRSGALRLQEATLALYRQRFPGQPVPVVDLTDHVVQGTVGGLFIEAGVQEQTIRETPAARRTPRLSALFGGA